MSSDAHLGGASDRGPLNDVPADRYDVLRHPRRIRILELLDTSGPLSLTELTTAVIDSEGRDVADGETRHEVYVGLVHNHLPRLAEHDVVDWDDDDEVSLAGEPPVRPATLSMLLEVAAEDDAELLDRLVHPVRIALLEALASGDRTESASLAELASELATQEPAVPADTRAAKITLHHSHLPALESAGLVEYDTESRRISIARIDDVPMLVR
ncbi:DUF7344 domain-containing protein [Halopiger djelfimassiliensis]|uniref:DUF7344 domain-containing protein n=1 Tax=Halopiger djelfimassiliensis TaxID=1293047 RepID=UPI000677E8E6|nr:helix-turn-helix transcriptional regulator [Halopiger djelfimassiliensis]